MTLVRRIADLVVRVGGVVGIKIDASHPGVAKAWVCFGCVHGRVTVRAAHNVSSVTRTDAGRYRVTFAKPMPDANYCWTAWARNASISQQCNVSCASRDGKTPRYIDVSCMMTSPRDIHLSVDIDQSVDVHCAGASDHFADADEINLVAYR